MSTTPTLDQGTTAAKADTSDSFGLNVGEQIEQHVDLEAAPMETDEMTNQPSAMTPPFASEQHSWFDQSTVFGLPCNVGRTDQKIRIGVGAAFIAAAAFAPLGRGWRTALAVIGAAEVLSGATRYCPISHAIGVNSCGADEQ